MSDDARTHLMVDKNKTTRFSETTIEYKRNSSSNAPPEDNYKVGEIEFINTHLEPRKVGLFHKVRHSPRQAHRLICNSWNIPDPGMIIARVVYLSRRSPSGKHAI